MNTNYTVLIAALANHIWDTLNADNTVSTDTYAWVAADLESAETFAEEYRFSEAASFLMSAARQVFGVYSDEYANIAKFFV
jgi:hypothetical protein